MKRRKTGSRQPFDCMRLFLGYLPLFLLLFLSDHPPVGGRAELESLKKQPWDFESGLRV